MEASERWRKLFFLGVLFSILAVYAQTLGHGFSLYDDDIYVTDNWAVLQGLTLKSVAWVFTTGYSGTWHPLTWLTHMSDVDLFGLWAGGHHAVNVLLHIASTILLFRVLVIATGVPWASGFAAALFAVHPLHVESVAWIAERKDVLCAFFWMLSLLAYVHYARRPTILRYAAVTACFVLGLLAKPMIVTLPFTLLLLDYWPLRRHCGGAGSDGVPTSPASLVLEKIPLLVLSAITSVMTLRTQESVGALPSIDRLPLSARVPNAAISAVEYLWKTVWPSPCRCFIRILGETTNPGSWLWQ
jgi:protein O-mannosyl-transferase